MDGKDERWINEWYCKCRDKYIDIGNFGGGELFVIEGDSLLFKFLYDPETDFLDFSQPFGGGQFLALTFLVENFLKKLKEREFVFHIVFFDVNKSIWNNRPKLRLAREIIINHLKSDKIKVPIFSFENWWNEKWREYLDNKQPLFILTGDGSTEYLEIKESKDYDENVKNSPISGIATNNSLKLTIVLRAFIFFSLHMDMPVALLPGLDFRDSHVYSFLIERNGNVDLETQKKLADIEKFTIEAISIYDEKSEWLKDSVENFDLTSIKDLLTSSGCLDVWSGGGKRIALMLLSLTGVLTNNKDKPDFHYLARIFLLHLILLDYLPLKLRAIPSVDDSDSKTRVELFLQDVYLYCAKIYTSDTIFKETKNFQDLKNNLYDLLDARLFVSLIQFQCDSVLNFDGLPTEIKQRFDACWNLLKQLCECYGLNSLDVDDKTFNERFRIKSYQKSNLEYDKKPRLFPFEYDFFKECLGDMSLKLPENSEIEIDTPRYGLIRQVDYDESTYNYSLKLSKGPKAASKSEAYYEKHKNSLERKGYQQYVRFLEKYAASLSGTQGYYRQKIIVDRSGRKESSKSSKSSSKAKKESTGAKKAREKIEQDSLKNTLETSDQYLDDALKEISKDGNIRNQLNFLNIKLERTDKIKHPFTMLRGQFKKLEFLFKLWTEHCMNSKVKYDWSIPIDILHQVFNIAQNSDFQPFLDEKMKDFLVEILSRLKLNDCKERLKKIFTDTSKETEETKEKEKTKEKTKEKAKEKTKEKTKEKEKKETKEKKKKEKSIKFNFPSQWTDLSVGMSDVRFQMLYAGHLMDRNTNSVKDDRVKHFMPDAWQVDVLNVIDKDESALLCCPTSSGKTFISYYAMEKVLRESDDGILVYVSPTKALVNQVTAEVYGRFEKNYDHGDKTTWGIYTREYRENHDKCQILVTVPQMLETLIFSPQRASWAQNIKRIIFDEIHMIGSEGGEFYDRLLLLSKSIPILALSATVGNPGPFNDWIAKSKKVRGQRMKLIETKKRFSDLQQYAYLPKFPLTSLLETSVNPKEKQRQNKSIVPINPVFSLSMSILKECGIPDDMKLVPSQCVQLWDVMKKYAGDNPPKGLDELDPDKYFKDIGYIVKDDADEYERKLKEIFINYANDDSLNHIVQSTIEELGTDIKNGFTKLESTANVTRCGQLLDVMKRYVGDNPSNGLDELNTNIHFKEDDHVVRDDVDEYEQKLKRVFIKCIQPWNVLKGHADNIPPNGLDKLEPNIYFKDIVGKYVDEYERKLKEAFEDSEIDDSLNDTIESAILQLGTDIKKGFTKIESTTNSTQCVQLWNILKEHAGNNTPNGLDELEPSIYFKDIDYNDRKNIDEYEKKLKEVFKDCVIINDIIESAIEKLGTYIKNEFTKLEPTVNATQCVQLWNTLKEYINDDPPEELDELEPNVYFKNIDYAAKNDAGEYEEKLKQAFKNRDTVESDIENLGTYIKNGLTKLESTSSELAKKLDVYGDKFLEEGIIPLLCELSAQDKLPAILFHFDEKGCVELASHIVRQLELAEKEKRDNDPEYQAKKKAAISQKEAYEKDLKRRRDKKSSAAPDDDEPESEEPVPIFFDWEAHDPNFTFVNQKARINSEEFEEIVGPLRYKMTDNSELLVAALERGIGVHHTDLSRKYLSAVEILFRKRYLQVVIATGTLALGINMPCKTTVFVGDSVSLTALQYRQMSGRSGRRGFDPLGHVVFFGITLTKIVRLLMSRLPKLSRHFPLTTALTLRSFNLLNQCKARNADDYDFAKDIIKGLFGESFFFLGKEYSSERTKYQLRFSVEYLIRESFLNQKGNLINLSATASHLNFSEPSNFAFAILFKHGVFHEICSESKTNEEMMNNIILILSRLFNRIKLRKISRNWYKNNETPSKIILPPLPEKSRKILEQHNERILETYTDYVITFAKNNASKISPDNILPLSSINIPPKNLDQNLLKEDPLISKFESTAISFIARSPFIAMCSSLGDIFNNLEDLTNHLHKSIYLDLYSIPFIKIDEILNAYVIDFFSHGQEKTLVEANGIRRGEVWHVLNEFFGSISSIVIALRNRNFSYGLEESEEQVLKGFEMVLGHFSEKFVQIWA